MVLIYGASDDLIEVEGDVEEEYYVNSDLAHRISLSNGAQIRVTYDGFWRLTVERAGEGRLVQTVGMDEDSDYSDTITITDVQITSVSCTPIQESSHGTR